MPCSSSFYFVFFFLSFKTLTFRSHTHVHRTSFFLLVHGSRLQVVRCTCSSSFSFVFFLSLFQDSVLLFARTHMHTERLFFPFFSQLFYKLAQLPSPSQGSQLGAWPPLPSPSEPALQLSSPSEAPRSFPSQEKLYLLLIFFAHHVPQWGNRSHPKNVLNVNVSDLRWYEIWDIWYLPQRN